MTPALYSSTWLLMGWAVMGFALWHALRAENWSRIAPTHVTGWLAACVIILLSWQLRAQIQSGIAFHLLGSTALCLIAGQHRALLGMAAVVLISALFGHLDWTQIALVWLLKAAVPIWICSLLLAWAQKKLVHNYFVYIFLNSFGAAALGMWVFGLLHCLVLASSGFYEWGFLQEEILPYYFLMGWPEAFATGLNLTLLVVWQPQWVSSFDDRKYLQKHD
ncbi:energy-coupling factor ABC transporter permease [Chitinibacter sp. GC72]|uniref:energy-coupling factor ABC transporter permease n=1 Tax=Chitinibacter sp. GC72 TaxID=1526917 RepID=UPI0012F8136B|nr:energy-coupling factor ABC transporter permease [Chitinibacter sp. GC72]